MELWRAEPGDVVRLPERPDESAAEAWLQAVRRSFYYRAAP